MLVLFSGAGWEEHSNALRDSVLDIEAFRQLVQEQNLVLVVVNFPQNPQAVSEERLMEIDSLRQRYGVNGLPSVLLLDAKERPISLLFGAPKSGEAYLGSLRAVLAAQDAFEKAVTEAQGLSGEPRALALAAALDALPQESRRYHNDIVKDILQHDPQDKTGYKAQQEKKERIKDQVKHYNEFLLKQNGKNSIPELIEGRVEALNMLMQEEWEPTLRMLLCKFVSDTYAAEQDLPRAIEYLQAAIEAAPAPALAQPLTEALQALEKRAAEPPAAKAE